MTKASIVEQTLIPHAAFEEAQRRLDQCYKYSLDSPEPVCLALVGESRTGKSRSIEEFRLKHTSYRTAEGFKVPILCVQAPSKPTVKSLAEVLLENLGDPKPSAGTENAMTCRLKHLMRAAGTRMIIIDEFQHFQDKGTHKIMYHVADWLKVLVDTTHIALVVSGLPSCLAVVHQNEQLAGRFLSPIHMPRFDWRSDDDRDMFIAILEAFHVRLSQYYDLPDFGDESMAFRFYCGTGGLIGYVARFLRTVVWNAEDCKSRVISLSDLERGNQTAVWGSDGISKLLNPFSRDFIAAPNEALLAEIRKLGTREIEIPKKSYAKQLGGVGGQGNISEILGA